MALSRRTGQRFQASIWPGFVDAITALLLVLVFMLTIFMVVQFVLRETISGQETELDQLTEQVQGLADALGLERNRARGLEEEVGRLDATLAEARTLAEEQRARIVSFEEQVAGLLAERDAAIATGDALRAEVSDLETAQAELLSEQETLQLALAQARDEIDEGAEAARLAAARREALQALIADLRRRGQEVEAEREGLVAEVSELEAELSQEEAARLAEAAAAEALRDRLANADTELTALTLSLEAERARAEETLTLLAAAEAARDQLDRQLSEATSQQDDALSEAERRAALLAIAQQELTEAEEISAERQREVALLNEQVAALRTQLGALQALLDDATARDSAANVQIQNLGRDLNAALARVAVEERRRRELEEAERRRLEAEAEVLQSEAEDLERYRSEFFGQLRAVLGGREGVRIEGDRFVFSSEVLFPPAEVNLSPEGRTEIAKVAEIIQSVADEIPPQLDWVIRVDGHTDDRPLSGSGRYRDNWELSQGRALSVVRYMIDDLGIAPGRLAATGFGEYQPVNSEDSETARAQNRRIELKFTEK